MSPPCQVNATVSQLGAHVLQPALGLPRYPLLCCLCCETVRHRSSKLSVIKTSYQDNRFEQYKQAGLNAKHIRGKVLRLAERIDVPVLQV